MSKPLVSVIIPCYNGEKFVHRLFDSLLGQSFQNIEIFFINDGSTDQTEKVVSTYISKFEHLGIKFTYMYQENAGQAAALNNALKLFTGDYLVWPDSDDFYYPNSLENFINFMVENPQFKIVRCKTNFICEESEQILGTFSLDNPNEDAFEDCLLERNFLFCPISFMIDAKAFLKILPSREIFVSRGGQNWQMLLPMLYYYPCGYIKEVNANYLVRSSSHSRNLYSIDDFLERRLLHKEILVNTLSNISLAEKDSQYYSRILDDKYCRIFYQEYLNRYLFGRAFFAFLKIRDKQIADCLYILRLFKCKLKSLLIRN